MQQGAASSRMQVRAGQVCAAAQAQSVPACRCRPRRGYYRSMLASNLQLAAAGSCAIGCAQRALLLRGCCCSRGLKTSPCSSFLQRAKPLATLSTPGPKGTRTESFSTRKALKQMKPDVLQDEYVDAHGCFLFKLNRGM